MIYMFLPYINTLTAEKDKTSCALNHYINFFWKNNLTTPIKHEILLKDKTFKKKTVSISINL